MTTVLQNYKNNRKDIFSVISEKGALLGTIKKHNNRNWEDVSTGEIYNKKMDLVLMIRDREEIFN